MAFLLLSPFWLPLAGSVVAKRFGIEWDSADAQGYSIITFSNLRFKDAGIDVAIEQLVAPQPVSWLSGIYISGRPSQMSADNVHIVVRESDAQRGSSTSPVDLAMNVESTLKKVLPYTPTILIGAVNLRIEENGFETTLRDLRLQDYAIEATVSDIQNLPATTFRLLLAEESVFLAARSIQATDDFFLRASMNTSGPVPEFVVEAHAGLEPFIGPEGSGSSLHVDVMGDLEELTIREFHIRSNWLNGSLSDPVSFNYTSKAFSGFAHMQLDADLGLQTRIPATGVIEAQVEVIPPGLEEMDLRFSFTGKDLVVADIRVAGIDCAGLLAYPLLTVTRSQLLMEGNSRVLISGMGDIEKRELDGTSTFTLSPDWLKELELPFEFIGPVSGEVGFSGPLTSLAHSGRLDPVSVEIDNMPELTGRFTWGGTGLESLSVEGLAESSRSGRLEFDLRIEKPDAGSQVVVHLDKAILGSFEMSPYSLQSPVTAHIETSGQFLVKSISPFELANPDSRIYGHYNLDTGSGTISGKNLDPDVFEAWTLKEFSPVVLDEFHLLVESLSPHLQATFDVSLHGTDSLVDALGFHLVGRIDSSGVELSTLEGLIDGSSFCSGHGNFPLLIHPTGDGDSGSYTLIKDGLLSGNLSAEISKGLIDDFSEIPFLDLFHGSRLNLKLDGTVESPNASLQMYLERLDVLGRIDERLDGLVFQGVQLGLNLSPELLEIQNLQASVNGGRLDVNGFIPTEFLRKQFEAGKLDWRVLLKQATLDASVKDFRTAEFQGYMPVYLRAKGSVNGFLELNPGLDVSGNLWLSDFGFRPTIYSQPVEQIQIGLRIDNTRLHIHEASAMLGDSLINLSGFFDFNDFVNPLFSIRLKGKRTPLVRTTDLLLLSDLDLSLDQEDVTTPATLSGTMNLRDGVLLLDIDPLGARTSGKALPKPPFFSVSTTPFAAWNIDVSLTGEEAVRFRSQFVNALLSVNADLSGTLENPVWVGEVRTKNGKIIFPGTRLSVSHGEFYITREQQDTIQLNLNSIGQTASYVVSMRVGGSVDDPQVSFASTPALTNAEIFQLLATGSLDRSGVGSFGLYLGRGMFGPGGGGEGLLDRLSVEVGRDISESGRNTIDVFYDLSERFRLHGQYDKYDAQNLDLEWEVFSK